jgi:hypothetical protein
VNELEIRTERCPYCNQPITRDEFDRIQEKIRAEEKQKLRVQEVKLREQFEKERHDLREKWKEEKQKLETKNKQLEEERKALRETFDKEYSGKLKSEQEKFQQQIAEKDRQAKLQEKANREKLEKGFAQKFKIQQEYFNKQFDEQTKRAEEKSRVQVEEQQKKRKELEGQIADLKEKQAKTFEEGKKEGRLESDKEKRKLQEQVADLQRQLEKKTSDELGSMSEEDLTRILKDAFPDDKISRVAKGEEGGDVKHEVMYKGIGCGLIVYESKNVKTWSNSFLARAKDYKTIYNTPYVVLVSISFPAKENHFCIKESIIVVHPSIVVYVAAIIRQSILQLHRASLSLEEKETKMHEIYSYLAGDEFKVRLGEIFGSVKDLKKFQSEEKTRHNKLWSEQEQRFNLIQQSAFKIQSRLSKIIERTD